MEKLKKYILPIILVIVLAIVIIIGILKMISTKKDIETASIEETNDIELQEEEETILAVNINEVESEENVQQVEEQPQEEIKEKDEQKEEVKEEKKEDNIPYYIKINYTQNVVTIYTKDGKGNYTVPIKAMVCSCGTATPTSGTYKISNKYKWGKLFGGVSGQYCTRIVKSILFHSVPYLTHGDNSSLEYWEYDKLGTTASAGCIRLTVEDAKWIYSNCVSGTQVEFYSDSNPGPLGKPSAQKISEDEAVRGWDPTDPDVNNPWKTYVKTPEVEIPTETIPEVPSNQEQSSEIVEPNEEEKKEQTEITEPKDEEEKEQTETTEPKDEEEKEQTEITEPKDEEEKEQTEITEPEYEEEKNNTEITETEDEEEKENTEITDFEDEAIS